VRQQDAQVILADHAVAIEVGGGVTRDSPVGVEQDAKVGLVDVQSWLMAPGTIPRLRDFRAWV
jgi:hypothetical protein